MTSIVHNFAGFCRKKSTHAQCNQTDGETVQPELEAAGIFVFVIQFNALLPGSFCINVNYFVESFLWHITHSRPLSNSNSENKDFFFG